MLKGELEGTPEPVLDEPTEKLETCACGEISDYHTIRRLKEECPMLGQFANRLTRTLMSRSASVLVASALAAALATGCGEVSALTIEDDAGNGGSAADASGAGGATGGSTGAGGATGGSTGAGGTSTAGAGGATGGAAGTGTGNTTGTAGTGGRGGSGSGNTTGTAGAGGRGGTGGTGGAAACSPACGPGSICTGGACVCVSPCPSGSTCVAAGEGSACVCAGTGQMLCPLAGTLYCVDTRTSTANCGACGHRCEAPAGTCSVGECVAN
jgi:hypothetical protein